MELLMTNNKMRKDMGVSASLGVKKYERNNIANLWEELFLNTSPE